MIQKKHKNSLFIVNIIAIASLCLITDSSVNKTFANNQNTILAWRNLCRTYKVKKSEGLDVYRGRRVLATIPYDTVVKVTAISRDRSRAFVYAPRASGWANYEDLECYEK